MKITLDQSTLAQAVISHLRGAGVTADISEVVFRYTRTPYTVFAEVELSEPKAKATAAARVTAKEPVVVEPAPAAPIVPIVDPDSLPALEEPTGEVQSSGTAEPL